MHEGSFETQHHRSVALVGRHIITLHAKILRWWCGLLQHECYTLTLMLIQVRRIQTTRSLSQTTTCSRPWDCMTCERVLSLSCEQSWVRSRPFIVVCKGHGKRRTRRLAGTD